MRAAIRRSHVLTTRLVLLVLSTPIACGDAQPLPLGAPTLDPAPGEVTPTAASPAAAGWKPVTIVDGLEHPWSIVWLPGGDMLITERPGRIRRVVGGKLQPKPVAGGPDVLSHGQGGLMDISLHPQFDKNKFVYLTYAVGTPRENHTVLGRAKLNGDALTDLKVIFEVTPKKPGGQHFGSRILWLPDETMLLSIGDGGNPPIAVDGELTRFHAQKLTSNLGKVLRLNDDGSPAPDNPFTTENGARPEVWSIGHRNIQGLARDPASGRIWATEHGAFGGDELNLLEAGKNYGWPKATYSREYSGGVITDVRSLPGMQDPKVVWTPCIAPSGLAFYTGDKLPEWRGDLFAGGLVLRQIRRIDLNDAGEVQGQQTLAFDERVRDVRVGPDGYLYVLTDERNGKLLRIERAR